MCKLLLREVRGQPACTWIAVPLVVVLWIVLPARWPGLYWRRRLSWRGWLVVIALDTGRKTVVRHWIGPPLRAFGRANEARRARAEEELREELGREPTAEELSSRMGALFAQEHLARPVPPSRGRTS